MAALVAGGLVCLNYSPPASLGETEVADKDSPKKTAPTSPPPSASGCVGQDRFFEEEVWAKVGERMCLKCHQVKGDAADSKFILAKSSGSLDDKATEQNCQEFYRLSKAREGDQSRLLLKATGGLDHGGGQVLPVDSSGYRLLDRYVRHVNEDRAKSTAAEVADDYEAPPFFDGVAMLTPQRHVRRMTLSLAGRLPSPEELAAVEQHGAPEIERIIDRLLEEDAFYVRLKEGFNDIFLTIGIEDNAETLLSYDHFEKTRNWPSDWDVSHLPEKERDPFKWKLADVYRLALLREPQELITYIVRNNRPFTELLTADYIMVSPYGARGYGIFEEIKDQFKNPEDPFEFIPARLKALRNRVGQTQESTTGMYPHAGYLGMFHYLRRYPTTETNRNRLRARMFYQHFLGIDIMQLAPRVTDAAAVSARYKVPTMEAADCVVCHKTIDPVAGLFQDFNMEGHLGPRKEGWYADMFQSGFEGESMPPEERWRAPQWLGERAAKDPRFPVAMTEHVYYILMGRKVLQPPEDIDDPLFSSRRRAYKAQRQMIEEVAARFVASKFNLKVAIKLIAMSDFYRADGLSAATAHPQRRMELDDVGIVRLIAPEQLNRKLQAIFGQSWARLDDDLKMLYGGIDSLTVTERNADPSGAMGAIQRIMANDMACEHVARDFRLEPSERRLFPNIEPAVRPGDEASDQQIRKAIVHLCQRLLGRTYPADHREIHRVFELFASLVADAEEQKGLSGNENWFCGGANNFQTVDTHYTNRAWRGVVTYLLRQHDFLYE